MEKEYNIKEELLKQADQTPDADKKSIQKILAKDQTRIKRLKWFVAFSWLLVVVCFMSGAILVHFRHVPIQSKVALLSTMVITLKALFLIALFLTISLILRVRTLGIKQIHIRLSNIEEQLKKISKNQ